MGSGVSRLEVGVLLPQYPPCRWADTVGTAIDAEAAGLDSVWLEDHLLVRAAGEPDTGPWECWTFLAAIAARTERVSVGTIVTATAFRNPALLAKMAASVDEVSEGRLILGIGAGWHEPEFRAFGYPYDRRVSRFEDAVEIIARLLRTGHADHAGRYATATDLTLVPRGPRPTGPPLLIGGTGPRVLGLVARHADLSNRWAHWQDGRLLPSDADALLDAACIAIDRDPRSLARSAIVAIVVPDRPSQGGIRPERLLAGSLDQVVDGLRTLHEAGFTSVQVLLDPTERGALPFLARVVERLRA
jgi:alkanesulfonate monooxygenase SsuD/methylene tetrahydromethanopterin reductase-like flavin-dependent oxidoreductase (luciferase family)